MSSAPTIAGDNNHFALAMVFILPVVYCLYSSSAKPLARLAFLGTFVLIFVSIIGTFSRGGFITLVAVGFHGLLTRITQMDYHFDDLLG